MDTTTKDSGEPLKSGSAVEERQSAITKSQSQLDLLTDLSRRLQTLRQFPGSLLRSEHALGENQVLQGPLSSTLKGSFTKYVEDLRALHVAVVEEKVQDVLRTAAESEQRDGAGIKYAREKETQKRQCVFLHSLSLPPPPPPSTHVQFVAASYARVEYIELLPCSDVPQAPSLQGHTLPSSTRSQVHSLHLQPMNFRLRSESYRHTSGSSMPRIQRRCCTFTWRPDGSRAVLRYPSYSGSSFPMY
jgi:hypothetical protein